MQLVLFDCLFDSEKTIEANCTEGEVRGQRFEVSLAGRFRLFQEKHNIAYRQVEAILGPEGLTFWCSLSLHGFVLC